ncbi:single-stranded DNA-binding protein [bacterium]|nr:MAG: single-stranded DNA-binding protein [bacterium]
MNRVQLFGNVGNDPDTKHLESGKIITKFSLATNKSYKKGGEKITETQWHNILLWNKLAEIASKYVKKGSSIIIEGEISYRSYENKDGQTVYITEIIGSNLHLVGKKEEPKEDKQSGLPHESGFSDINDLPGSAEDDPSFDPFA